MITPLDQALAAWPLVAATAFIFGTTAFVLASASSDHLQRDDLVRACLPRWRWLILLLAALSPVALMIETSSIAGGDSLAAALPILPQVMRETHIGRMWCWRVAVTAILISAAWVRSTSHTRAGILCALAGVLLLMTSLSSHAVDKGAIAVGIHFIHQGAGSLWLGAISGLWLGSRVSSLGDRWVEQAAPRVSMLAGWSVGVLLVTGLYMAYEALGLSLDRLLYSAYGRTLLLKVALFAATVTVGGYNRYRLMPATRHLSARRTLVRNVAVETVSLVAVMGAAALLANTPPVH